jgi:ATP-binding cassette, subfamily B, bacterial MsbA
MLGARTWLAAVWRTDDMRLIRRILLQQGALHWRGYALAIAMTGVVAACTAATAYLLGSVINTLYVERNFAGVVALSLATVVLCSVKGLAAYGHALILARVGNRIVAETQRRIFDKLLHEGVHYFANKPTSEFMASASHGATALSNVLNLLVLTLGRDLLTLLALVAVMLWQDPMLSLIGFAVMPLVLLGVQKLMARARRIATTQFTGAAAILQTMQETVQGFRVIKAFTLEDTLRTRIAGDIAKVERASNKMARVANRSAPLIEALGGVAIGMVCLYAGYRILQTNAPPGEFVAFMTAFLLSFDPARRVARLNIDLTGSLVSARILFGLLDSPPSEPDEPHRPALDCREGLIEVSDVAFAYQPGPFVLDSLSFVAKPRQITALVGTSGGGKSTILSLLLRFYDVDRGTIAIDGQNVRDVSRASLRRQISYVGQDIFLFRGTIRENILMGNPKADNEQLLLAAKAAFAHDFIASFPNGYDTQVGEFGWQLSLGQRQRIAVARALIKNAPIVLLDEPTASLDSESEHHVQEALRRLFAGRTAIVVAHRLNTIKDADCIHVVENGRIVESGRHDDLLQRHGRYTNFFNLQFPAKLEFSAAVPLVKLPA